MYNEVFVPNTLSSILIDSQVLTGGAGSLRVAVRPGSVLRLVNTHASQNLYITFGDGTETATSNDMLIPPGGAGVMAVCFVRVPLNAKSMAYIAAGASTLVNMVQGQ